MKKSDLKKLIKPIVKECINEVLIEEGLLTEVVSQVAQGMQTNTIVETVQSPPRKNTQRQVVAKNKISENRKKLLDIIGRDAYNGVDLFENTTPMTAQQDTSAGSVDLGNPTDAGVDISSLMGDASKIWKAMK